MQGLSERRMGSFNKYKKDNIEKFQYLKNTKFQSLLLKKKT